MKRSKTFLLLICISLIFVTGCAGTKEEVRRILGISTEVLEEGRKEGISRTFNYDYFTCYSKVLDILKAGKSYIYKEAMEEQMIALYVSEEDTTPVGVFFKEIDKQNTQLEISSPSTYAKELIAERLFSKLEK